MKVIIITWVPGGPLWGGGQRLAFRRFMRECPHSQHLWKAREGRKIEWMEVRAECNLKKGFLNLMPSSNPEMTLQSSPDWDKGLVFYSPHRSILGIDLSRDGDVILSHDGFVGDLQASFKNEAIRSHFNKLLYNIIYSKVGTEAI